MRRALFYILQFTWGFPQNLLGLILWILNIGTKREMFHGCIVSRWKYDSCLSLGAFLFVSDDIPDPHHEEFLKKHEFGHTVQSLILGPLYLPLIGIPSFIWANSRHYMKKRSLNDISYYSFYTEKWANNIFKHCIKDGS